MIARLTRRLKREEGVALATVIVMMIVLSVISVTLIDQVTTESDRAASNVSSDQVYQVAEAGIDDYIAKLTEDPQYYAHCVAKGEATRRDDTTAALVQASTSTSSCQPGGASVWSPNDFWTYPNNKDRWFAGTGSTYGNSTSLRGYAYDLMITPPSTALGTNYVDIVSTGCKVVDPNASPLVCDSRFRQRAVEVHVRRSTPADFQYIVPPMDSGDPHWASQIYGTMYSPGDIYANSSADFFGNVMSETTVYGVTSSMLHNGARIYDQSHPDIRTQVKNAMSISDFTVSLTDIKRLSALNSPSTDFEDATAAAWRINFTSNGNVQVWKCVFQSGAPDPASSQPFCGGDLTLSAAAAKNATSFNVSGSTGEFPGSGTVYVGPNSSGQVDSFSYQGKTDTGSSGSFSASGSGDKLAYNHAAGERVSFLSSGVTWPVPEYNGVPSNGTIYTGQDAIISWPNSIPGYIATNPQDGSPIAQVNGMFTLGSAGDVIIAGDVHYASEPANMGGTGAPDNDVLGLIANSNLWLAKYSPDQLWWRAATIALNGEWSDYAARHQGIRGNPQSMTFVGSMAYAIPGIMQSGSYGYDTDTVYRVSDDGSAGHSYGCPPTATDCSSFDALKFIFPPSFPIINGMETTMLFHEVAPAYTPPVVPNG